MKHLQFYNFRACSLPVLLAVTLVSMVLSLVITPAHATKSITTTDTPISAYIAIIIDDMGYKLKHDQRALTLPGQVTYAFLPYTPQASKLAKQAHASGNEVMLHLPMQSLEPVTIGPGALTEDLNREEFKISVLKSILSIPHVRGVNNHMGSLITSQQTQMDWLMEELTRTSLFFVDSRTTASTLAQKTAIKFNVANTQRNIFLDHVRDRQAIEHQFDQLVTIARKTGAAVAIGHPVPETMDVLEERIPQLQAAGIQLIPVSQLIHKQHLISQNRQQKFLPQDHTLTHNQITHQHR